MRIRVERSVVCEATYQTLGYQLGAAALAFDRWWLGEQRLARMEQWIDVHGSTLTESEWTDRLSRLETFREVVFSRRSDWLLTAIESYRLFDRTKSHQDVERIKAEWSIDYQHRGTTERDLERQWAHFFQDDYSPPPF